MERATSYNDDAGMGSMGTKPCYSSATHCSLSRKCSHIKLFYLQLEEMIDCRNIFQLDALVPFFILKVLFSGTVGSWIIHKVMNCFSNHSCIIPVIETPELKGCLYRLPNSVIQDDLQNSVIHVYFNFLLVIITESGTSIPFKTYNIQ